MQSSILDHLYFNVYKWQGEANYTISRHTPSRRLTYAKDRWKVPPWGN